MRCVWDGMKTSRVRIMKLRLPLKRKSATSSSYFFFFFMFFWSQVQCSSCPNSCSCSGPLPGSSNSPNLCPASFSFRCRAHMFSQPTCPTQDLGSTLVMFFSEEVSIVAGRRRTLSPCGEIVTLCDLPNNVASSRQISLMVLFRYCGILVVSQVWQTMPSSSKR